MTSSNLSARRVLRSQGRSFRSRPCQKTLISSSDRTRVRGCSGSSLAVDARAGGYVVAAGFGRPIEQTRGGTPHVAGIAHRRLAAVLAGHDVVRQRCNVVLGDFARDLLAEPGAEETPQMAGDALPAFEPGAHFPVRLLDRRLHPRDPLSDDLVDGLAPLRLLRFPVAEGFGERRSARAPQAVDLVAGIFDGEGLGVVDAQPAGALLAGLQIGELEGEGRHASGDNTDVQARAFAVVDFDSLGDPLFAHAVGQDHAAIAGALASGFGGDGSIHFSFGSQGVETTGLGFEAFSILEGLKGLGPGPGFDEYSRTASDKVEKPQRTGYPACAGYDSHCVGRPWRANRVTPASTHHIPSPLPSRIARDTLARCRCIGRRCAFACHRR